MAVAHTDCMQARNHIAIRAGSFIADVVPRAAVAGYCKTAIIFIATAVITVLLIVQVGKLAGTERRAGYALSHAWQLLREADDENHKVRPLPLSLASASDGRTVATRLSS
jgi:hypothetical protein